MQLKKSKNYIDNFKNLELSIQFSLDGFSFLIKDISRNKSVYFSEYTFSSPASKPEDLLQHIEPIFKSDKQLQYDFKKVLVYYKNDLYTLVPNAFFDEGNLASYVKHSIKTYPTDLFAFDDLDTINAKLVYIPYVNTNNFLFQNYGEFEFNHYQSLFTEKLIRINPPNAMYMYADLENSSLHLSVLKGKEVSLINSFQITSATDCLYYILFTAEQLNIENTELRLFLTGSIRQHDETYQLFAKYIQHIEFLEAKNELNTSLDVPKHRHFTLMNT